MHETYIECRGGEGSPSYHRKECFSTQKRNIASNFRQLPCPRCTACSSLRRPGMPPGKGVGTGASQAQGSWGVRTALPRGQRQTVRQPLPSGHQTHTLHNSCFSNLSCYCSCWENVFILRYEILNWWNKPKQLNFSLFHSGKRRTLKNTAYWRTAG